MALTTVFETIKVRVDSIHKSKPFLIAINGIEGSGKTTFARLLTAYLISKNYKAIHVPIDGFHYDRAHRYRQGKDSARGYYEDSYDENAFVEKVLKLSQSERPAYIPASHDLQTDQYLDLALIPLSFDSIIITDGANLFKPICLPYWDMKIYLRTDFGTARRRGALRDQSSLGGYDAAILKFQNRYHAASNIYQAEVNPEKIADMVIDNTDFKHPKLVLV